MSAEVLGLGSVAPMASLPLAAFRFVLTPRETLYVPARNKGNVLRGAFGTAFRHTACLPECREPRLCPRGMACPYRSVFEPVPPPGADTLSKNQDIPRPFIFRPPPERKTCYKPDEEFEFELVLVGRGIEFLSFFIIAFRDLAAEGWGLNRARCVLQSVGGIGAADSQARIVYDGRDGLVRPLEPGAFQPMLKLREIFLPASRRLRLRLLTPTSLKVDGKVIREPEFHHIFKRVRDRVSSLATFFGSGPLMADFRGLGERAERIATAEAHYEWVELARTSSRTGQRHELSGVIGEATFEGDFQEFLPWLALAEWVHVGRHAAWGNGRVSIEQIDA